MVPDERIPRTTGFGAIGGVVAYLIGYAITYLWRAREIEDTLRPMEALLTLFEAEPIGTWRAVGWLFYNGHFVDTRVAGELGPIETVSYVNFVAEGAGSLELLYVLPPALLVLVGASIAWRAAVTDPVLGAIRGGAVIAGYLPLVAIGLVVFAYETIRPDPVPAVLLAGMAYPVVFGGIGGAVAAILSGR